MLDTDLTRLPQGEELTMSGNITAMVGMAGGLSGVMSIRCNPGTAEKIAGRMLGAGWSGRS